MHIPPPAPGDRPDGEQPSACSNAWVAALALAAKRTDEFARRLFEHPVPRTIHLVLPSPLAGMAIGRTSAGASFAETELWIAAPNPETLPCHDDREPLLWAAGVMDTMAHEMQHIQAYQVPPAPPPLLGDEVSASMVGHCFRYLVLGGLPYDMVRAVRSDGTELTSIRDVLTQVAQGQMLTSMAGKVIADLHRRHRLGPGEVRGTAGEQLLRLCLARRSEFGVPSDPDLAPGVLDGARRPASLPESGGIHR